MCDGKNCCLGNINIQRNGDNNIETTKQDIRKINEKENNKDIGISEYQSKASLNKDLDKQQTKLQETNKQRVLIDDLSLNDQEHIFQLYTSIMLSFANKGILQELEINDQMTKCCREGIIKWIAEVCESNHYQKSTFSLSIQLLDNYIYDSDEQEPQLLEAICVSVILLAAAMRERWDNVSVDNYLSRLLTKSEGLENIEIDDIINMQVKILIKCDTRITGNHIIYH